MLSVRVRVTSDPKDLTACIIIQEKEEGAGRRREGGGRGRREVEKRKDLVVTEARVGRRAGCWRERKKQPYP